MYAEDPRDWADRLLDAAPRPGRYTLATRRSSAPTPPRADSLLAILLTAGEFTAATIAERTGCWESSVHLAIANHRASFVQVRARHGNAPAVWRAKQAGEVL